MKKEDLLKLAKIAGVVKITQPANHLFESWTNGKVRYIGWQPHEDLNQAFECLEGWKKGDIERKAFIRVTSSYDGGDYSVCLSNYNIESNKSLSLAICKAVLKAVRIL